VKAERRILPACFAVLCAASIPAWSAALFLADTPFGTSISNRIYTVEPATGVMTLVADVGPDYTPILGLAAVDDATLFAVGSDNSGTICTGTGFACLLLRIELDPSSTTPKSVVVVGPVTLDGQQVDELTGLNFRNTGALYAISQATNGLYVIDTETAWATLVGISNADLYGGDLTFDSQDRLWVWVNTPASTTGPGLYQMNPANAQASRTSSDGVNMAGLAALGHTDTLYGADPPADRLWVVAPVTGRTGAYSSLTLDGSPFDHKRGDLDSPFCKANSYCDDGDACTANVCSPGGCRFPAEEALCDGLDDNCNLLVDEGFPDRDGDGQADCVDPDDDGDGVVDENDCAPWDDSKAAGAPMEIVTVRWTGPPATLEWASQGPGVVYDVIDGSLTDLLADGNVSQASCLAENLVRASYRDVRFAPSPGAGRYYLIRPEKTSCGTGTYGFASAGSERVPLVDCP
jgi:hypothetical protein